MVNPDLEDPPDIDGHRDDYDIVGWDMEPGDVLIFHPLVVHGSSGNASTTTRRRALGHPLARRRRRLPGVALHDAVAAGTRAHRRRGLHGRDVPCGGLSVLDGKVAVITGGGVGIGAAIARRFVAHGATVEVAEVDESRAAAIGAEPGIQATVVDVRDERSVEAWAGDVLARHQRVDVLVNNVGDYLRSVPFRQSASDHWDALHDINLRHIFVVTHAFLPTMLDRAEGSIINVHSVEALRGYPPDPVYAAYKAAAAHFTTSLAGELGRKGIRVNALAPDLTQTPQVDIAGNTPPDAEALWEAWAPGGTDGTARGPG